MLQFRAGFSRSRTTTSTARCCCTRTWFCLSLKNTRKRWHISTRTTRKSLTDWPFRKPEVGNQSSPYTYMYVNAESLHIFFVFRENTFKVRKLVRSWEDLLGVGRAKRRESQLLHVTRNSNKAWCVLPLAAERQRFEFFVFFCFFFFLETIEDRLSIYTRARKLSPYSMSPRRLPMNFVTGTHSVPLKHCRLLLSCVPVNLVLDF